MYLFQYMKIVQFGVHNIKTAQQSLHKYKKNYKKTVLQANTDAAKIQSTVVSQC